LLWKDDRCCGTTIVVPVTPTTQDGEMEREGLAYNATLGNTKDKSLDTSMVQLEDLIDQAFQTGTTPFMIRSDGSAIQNWRYIGQDDRLWRSLW
jgi:hypothetical protein